MLTLSPFSLLFFFFFFFLIVNCIEDRLKLNITLFVDFFLLLKAFLRQPGTWGTKGLFPKLAVPIMSYHICYIHALLDLIAIIDIMLHNRVNFVCFRYKAIRLCVFPSLNPIHELFVTRHPFYTWFGSLKQLSSTCKKNTVWLRKF